MVGESHHLHRHSASIGAVEHPVLCQFGIKGNLPEALKVESIKKDQAGLISQRSRRQELRDGIYRRKYNKEVTKDLKDGNKESRSNKVNDGGRVALWRILQMACSWQTGVSTCSVV